MRELTLKDKAPQDPIWAEKNQLGDLVECQHPHMKTELQNGVLYRHCEDCNYYIDVSPNIKDEEEIDPNIELPF